jgi:type II secretory pathway pseudopilin PulG
MPKGPKLRRTSWCLAFCVLRSVGASVRLHRRTPNAKRGLVPHSLGDVGTQSGNTDSGTTLVELSVVIATLILLTGIVSLGVGAYSAYRDGQNAGEILRSVKAAQMTYLADNPSASVSSLTPALLQPYMPNATWPTLPTVGSQQPSINCAVFPPVAVLNGQTYNPSGSQTNGLWNVGQW